MDRLRFDKLDDDGEVVVVDAAGTAYVLDATDELRAAVRRTASWTARMLAEHEGELRPKDIQTLVRAGVDPKELAATAGLEADLVVRYAAPVLDERAYVAQRAQAIALAHEDSAPVLGDLTVDRLAARGVNTGDLEWDAVREGARWIVSVTFTESGRPVTARWAIELATQTATALDDEARAISEIELADGLIPARRLSVVAPTHRREESLIPPAPEPRHAPPALVPVSGMEPRLDAGSAPYGGDLVDPLVEPVAPYGLADAGTQVISLADGPDFDSDPPPLQLLDDLAANRGLRQVPPLPPDGYGDGADVLSLAPVLETSSEPPPYAQLSLADLAPAPAPEPEPEPVAPPPMRVQRVSAGVIAPPPEFSAPPAGQIGQEQLPPTPPQGLFQVPEPAIDLGATPVQPAAAPVPLLPPELGLGGYGSPADVAAMAPAPPAPLPAAVAEPLLPAIEPDPVPEPSTSGSGATITRAKSRRASIPSWDEIVFGAKSE